jgi:hypothetical protein
VKITDPHPLLTKLVEQLEALVDSHARLEEERGSQRATHTANARNLLRELEKRLRIRAEQASQTLVAPQLTPADVELALNIIARPEFWCRAKLFRALEAARVGGVLDKALSEAGVPDQVIDVFEQHLVRHWGRP